MNFHRGVIRGKMSIVLGKMKNKFLVLATTMFVCSNAFAADINLSEIEFSTANKGFNIVLKTDRNVNFKKTIQSSDKLVIELKNTMTSDDFSTIYNDVDSINNVTVTPVGKDDLKIQIQGKNVNNSFVSVDSSASTSALIQQNFDSNQINLNLPMENYKPVYEEESFEEEEIEEESSMVSGVLSKLNSFATTQKHKSISNNVPVQKNEYRWITYLGLLIIMFSAFKNLVKPSQSFSIGLAHNIKDREKDLAEKLNTSVKETLSLRSKIAQSSSAPSINYGLKAYQNSQKNPYENVGTPIRPVRKETNISPLSTKQMLEIENEVKKQSSVSSNLVSNKERVSRPISHSPLYKEANVDSKKFLEAMTKIYEKNGRTDLAQGLKNNMNKVKF